MERERSKECSAFFLLEEGKLFIKKSSFKEFNLVFFTTERMVCFEMQPRQWSFSGTFCTLWPRQLRFSKGIYVFLNVSIHRRFINFSLRRLREKLQNVPWFEMDFVLKFAMCSADFTCVNGSTIQIVFSELF